MPSNRYAGSAYGELRAQKPPQMTISVSANVCDWLDYDITIGTSHCDEKARHF